MRFSWDPAKEERNVRERGLSFTDAPAMWNSHMLVWTDTGREYGETRQLGLGIVRGRVMVVGWVLRDADHIHLFTFRKANARERKRYQEAFQAHEPQAGSSD